MDSLKDRLREASAEYDSLESLVALIKELADMTARMPPGAIDLLRGAVRLLSETDSDDGRMWVLAKATVDERKSRLEGEPIAESVALAVEALDSLDPDLPRLVADADGALEALIRAAESLDSGAENAQQLWLPHVHEAFVALGFIAPKGSGSGRHEDAYGATRKRLERHGKVRIDKRRDAGHSRLLLLLSEAD